MITGIKTLNQVLSLQYHDFKFLSCPKNKRRFKKLHNHLKFDSFKFLHLTKKQLDSLLVCDFNLSFYIYNDETEIYTLLDLRGFYKIKKDIYDVFFEVLEYGGSNDV